MKMCLLVVYAESPNKRFWSVNSTELAEYR